MLKNYLKEVYRMVNYILNLIYPPKCIFCNTILPPGTQIEICDKCYGEAPFVKGKVCRICGQPITAPYGPDQCIDCKKTIHYFVQGISVFEYRGMVRDAIVRYKFIGRKRYSRTLGLLMLNRLRLMTNWPIFHMIVYTPLYKKKLINRGYNQAELLASVIADGLQCRLEKSILVKTRDTLPQSKLTRNQRFQNIKGAFAVRSPEKLQDMNILLVDDVYTTGATVNECARLLMEANANSVYVITAAIGKGYS